MKENLKGYLKHLEQKGFSLIELLVVIAIIGMLSTLATVSMNGARQKARDAKRKSDLSQIKNALELYNVQNEKYPLDTSTTCGNAGTIADSSGKICSSTSSFEDADGNVYIKSLMADPTNNATYFYQWTGDNAGDSSCLSVKLESPSGSNTHFKCEEGSCFENAGGC